MTCDVCTNATKENMLLANLWANSAVKPGEMWEVRVDVVSKSSYLGDTFKVNVKDLDTGECLYEGAETDLPAGTTVPVSFTGWMPDRDLRMRISLWDINWVYWDDCEDYTERFIKKGAVTLPPERKPTEEPIDWKKYATYGVVLVGIAGAYFLITRKPEAVKRGYQQAKEFAVTEYGKAKGAYETYRGKQE